MSELVAERLTPEELQTIAEGGWEPDPELQTIMGRDWAILCRPHPSGGRTRLMLAVAKNGTGRVTLNLPMWSEECDGWPKPVDYPGFALLLERELDALGIEHKGWPAMGIQHGGINDRVTIEVTSPDQPALAVNVCSFIDDVKGAAVAVAKAVEEAWAHISAFDASMETDPKVERLAVVAASSIGKDLDDVLHMLRARPPKGDIRHIIITEPYPAPADISYQTWVGAMRLDDRGLRGDSIITRTARSVTAQIKTDEFTWETNAFRIRNGPAIPDTVAIALRGHPVADVVKHPLLSASGLVIDSATITNTARRDLRLKVRSDLMAFEDVGQLAQALLSAIGR